VPLVRSVVGVVRDQHLPFLAAAIAYYAFVSLVPLVLLALAVATLVGGRAFTTRVVDLLGGALTDEALGLLEGALTGGTARGGATALIGAAIPFRGCPPWSCSGRCSS
jgi:membrane protein